MSLVPHVLVSAGFKELLQLGGSYAVQLIQNLWLQHTGETRQVSDITKFRDTAAFSPLAPMCGVYLAGAVIVDAVFVSGLLDPLREALNKFLDLLQLREDYPTILEVKGRIQTFQNNTVLYTSCSCY